MLLVRRAAAHAAPGVLRAGAARSALQALRCAVPRPACAARSVPQARMATQVRVERVPRQRRVQRPAAEYQTFEEMHNSTRRRPRFSKGSLVFFLVTGSGGSVYYFTHLEDVPVTGRTRFMDVSVASEVQLGQEAYLELLQRVRSRVLPASHRDVKLVKGVVTRLLQGRPDLIDTSCKWEVNVVDLPMVNAMVMPGGKIVVFRGILDMMERDEQRVAVILGHEIAHVVARHSAESMSHGKILFLASAVLAMYFDFGGLERLLLNWLFSLPRSRKHENEADEIGLYLLAAACYDPKAAPEVWRRMSRMADEAAIEFFSTHPSHKHREERLSGLLGQAEKVYRDAGCQDSHSMQSILNRKSSR